MTTCCRHPRRAEEYLVAEEESAGSAYWYFVEDPQLHLATQAEAVEVAAERTGSGYSVRVSASSLVKDLTLFPDRLDPTAGVDTALVTLQAGRSHTFQVTVPASRPGPGGSYAQAGSTQRQ